MTRLRVLLWRLLSLVRKGNLEHVMDEELDFHLQMEIAENLRKGMTPEEARWKAKRRLGGVAGIKETYRETYGLPVLQVLWQDLRFGFRMLRRSPGFSILAILCLTLGIGANAAVFSWIEGILFRPYPLVANQDRLLAVAGTDRGASGLNDVSWPDFLDFQRNCTLIDAFIAEKITGTTLSIGDRAERAPGSMVSANYFDAIGVHPILGRGFEPGEDAGRNAHPVTVISYQMWQDRFHGDPAIIGKTQVLSGLPFTIVGVAPKGFYGTFVGYAFQFWVPASMQEFDAGVYKLEDRGARWIEGYVRLKPGVTLEQAQAEMSAVAARLETDYPETNRGRGIRLFPLWQTPFNNAGALLPTLGIALVVVLSVLLIACANVGNLLLVRAFARRHEMTIRLAVGAGRGRLVKQLLTEGVILSGSRRGRWTSGRVLVPQPARAATPAARRRRAASARRARLARARAERRRVPGLDAAVRAGTRHSDEQHRSGRRAPIRIGRRRGRPDASWVRSSLVLVQMSLSFVLLVGAGLLIQSMQAIQNTSPGFSTKGVLTSSVDFVAAGYDARRAKDFEDTLIERLVGLGGVQSAAFARITPFGYRSYSSAPIVVDGYDSAPDEQPTVDYNEVGPGYLATMGIPLVSGREFTSSDKETAPLVAVVNEAMAAQYWRGRDPVGSRLQVKGRWIGVVGVAKISKYRNLMETIKPFFYVPIRQSSLGQGLHIRTSLRPETMAKALAREVRGLDANLAPGELITMQEQVDRTTAAQRIAVAMLGVFGGLALLLAAIGLYGVMSYTVSQSTRELGLRMALGADASDLLRLVMSQGLVLTAGGVVLGAAAALSLTRLIGYLLYKVSPRDPLAFGSAFVVMMIASLAACFLPAWRATRTDPVQALRD